MTDATAELSADDQDAIKFLPNGYRWGVLLVAHAKRALEHQAAARERLQLLELIERIPDQALTLEMVALIDPMSDAEYEMFSAARSLDPPDGGSDASYRVLVRNAVFGNFVRLNAGLRAAIRRGHVRLAA